MKKPIVHEEISLPIWDHKGLTNEKYVLRKLAREGRNSAYALSDRSNKNGKYYEGVWIGFSGLKRLNLVVEDSKKYKKTQSKKDPKEIPCILNLEGIMEAVLDPENDSLSKQLTAEQLCERIFEFLKIFGETSKDFTDVNKMIKELFSIYESKVLKISKDYFFPYFSSSSSDFINKLKENMSLLPFDLPKGCLWLSKKNSFSLESIDGTKLPFMKKYANFDSTKVLHDMRMAGVAVFWIEPNYKEKITISPFGFIIALEELFDLYDQPTKNELLLSKIGTLDNKFSRDLKIICNRNNYFPLIFSKWKTLQKITDGGEYGLAFCLISSFQKRDEIPHKKRKTLDSLIESQSKLENHHYEKFTFFEGMLRKTIQKWESNNDLKNCLLTNSEKPTWISINYRNLKVNEEWSQELTSFDALGAVRGSTYNVNSDDGLASPIDGAEVTASAFQILRVQPLLGRPIVSADEVIGGQEARHTDQGLSRHRPAHPCLHHDRDIGLQVWICDRDWSCRRSSPYGAGGQEPEPAGPALPPGLAHIRAGAPLIDPLTG